MISNDVVTGRSVSDDLVARVAVAVALGYRSTKSVANAAGCSNAQTHIALHALRDQGVVGFTDNTHGTIHSNVQIVARSL